MSTTDQSERELVITRLFDAPRDLVWRAWTDPTLGWGWGPREFTTELVEAEVVPGGAWKLRMVAESDGRELWSGGVYREVVPPQRLVFTHSWDTEDSVETIITVELLERGERTEMTFRQSLFRSAESRDSHSEGWGEAFDDLATKLAAAG